MFRPLYNVVSTSLIVLVVSMLSVNYLPDTLFVDFPFEPKGIETINYDSVIPQWNTQLSQDNVEYIQLNNILGPESIAVSKEGLLYTGLADGRIVELDPSKSYKLRKVLKFKDTAKCLDNVATRADDCGRFLQVRFQNNTLYALEANSGLYKIDIKTGSKTLLGPKPLNRINLYNSFTFDPKDPDIAYVTISSTRWTLLQIIWGFFEGDASGQIVALDIKTGKRVVILDGLMMANGIDVDSKRDRMIFSETTLSTIGSIQLDSIRADVKKAKDGAKLTDVVRKPLIPLVPGNPDNIIVEGDLAYIALPFVKLNGKELIDQLASMPNVRKAVARFLYGCGKILELVYDNLYKHPLLEVAYRELKCGHVIYRVMQTNKAAVIEYNLAQGSSRLLGSDKFGFISEASKDLKGNLLLGSFRSPFIAKVKV